MTGAEIAALRKRLGLSRAKMAARLGVDAVTIWRWETGRSHPLPLLARALDGMGGRQSWLDAVQLPPAPEPAP